MYSSGGITHSTLRPADYTYSPPSIQDKTFEKARTGSCCMEQPDEAKLKIVAVPHGDFVKYRVLEDAMWRDTHNDYREQRSAYLEEQLSVNACTTAKSDQEKLRVLSSSVQKFCDGINHRPCRAVSESHEHLFYKIVTPSDVGKLNRLVIPKQHAECYFPLDPSHRKRGLLLCFRDHIATGKLWWFRYSYWSSSQSYVLTKGWIRFVKEKKLQAGDIISFERGMYDEFYINCRRRPTRVLERAAQETTFTTSFTHCATNNGTNLQTLFRDNDCPDPSVRPKPPEAGASELFWRSYKETRDSSAEKHDLSWSTEARPWEGQSFVRVADPLNSVSEMRLFGVDLRFQAPCSAPKIDPEQAI
ncbi:hypothetical protein O6H91_03G126800 [Diphasiastrum complanatum]|uniref:Uncharacterized protein n=2 Tax=Diphasiastrum complanatum TaxID=34168 RepID=A0ACC2EBK7_DIPCM|nr:hypothetical protein O6H91_03G126800 [Diphasiastrum complanatum]KAJ7563818.1 hypothetical protein O6H91_03G126800 [Diphasiastrum complanatum]